MDKRACVSQREMLLLGCWPEVELHTWKLGGKSSAMCVGESDCRNSEKFKYINHLCVKETVNIAHHGLLVAVTIAILKRVQWLPSALHFFLIEIEFRLLM